MYFFDVPDGCGKNNVTPTCNFGRYLDNLIFTPNYMMKPTDPEGLFTTLGAFVTTFIGKQKFLYYSITFPIKKLNHQGLRR